MARPVAVAAILLTVAGIAAAEPRWTPLGPPATPAFARLRIDPANGTTAYALADESLWRSPGGAGAWRSIQTGLDGLPQAVAFDPKRPGRLYAAVAELDGSGSIRRSDDFGGHWSVAFHTPVAYTTYPWDLQVDPFAPDTLYWQQQQSLYRSRDAGRTWSCFNVAGGCVDFVVQTTAFALAPDRPGTMYVADSYDFFYGTHDGGATWSRSVLLENKFSPEFLVATRAPRTLYAWSGPLYRGGLTPCFVRSDDEGATWKAFLPEAQCGAPGIDVDDPLTVRIVVMEAGVPRLRVSRDGGESWSPAGEAPALGDLYVLPGQGLVLASDAGFFRAPGEQGPWRPANHGFAAAEIAAVLPAGPGVLAAPVQPYSYDRSKPPSLPLFLTEDGGRSWRGTPLTNPVALAADPNDPRRLIASAWRYGPNFEQRSRVLESRDGGHAWHGVVDPQTESRFYAFDTLAIDPASPQTFYGGNRFDSFVRSDDGGFTWRSASSGLKQGRCTDYYCETNRVSAILPDPGRSGAVAILFESQVYASDDGFNWQVRGPVTARQRLGLVSALTRDPQGALVAVSDVEQDPFGTVYRSTDEGVTWRRLGRLPSLIVPGRLVQATSVAATPAGLFVATNAFGVLRSTDGGRTWKAFNDGLPLFRVTSLVADPDKPARLFATVPQNGVYVIEP